MFVDRERRAVTELLAVLHQFHPNILLVHCGAEIERALAEIRPSLLTPVVEWSPRETSHPPAIDFGSLIVRGVECLTATQQRSLTALMDGSSDDLQIMSIARVRLFQLVSRGLFLEDLYYRLNVVLLEPSQDKRLD